MKPFLLSIFLLSSLVGWGQSVDLNSSDSIEYITWIPEFPFECNGGYEFNIHEEEFLILWFWLDEDSQPKLMIQTEGLEKIGDEIIPTHYYPIYNIYPNFRKLNNYTYKSDSISVGFGSVDSTSFVIVDGLDYITNILGYKTVQLDRKRIIELEKTYQEELLKEKK